MELWGSRSMKYGITIQNYGIASNPEEIADLAKNN